jgi:nitric oxide reductase NorD protein
MEEHLGLLWHKLISRTADTRYPEAGVYLSELRHTLGVLFRALGGDGGLEVVGSNATKHGARRAWLQRIAGTGKKLELAWRDDQTLRLPERIDLFPDTRLNRDLYLWLAALAVGDLGDEEPWIVKNQRLTALTLARYPGLRARYKRIAEAHLARRPDPGRLAPDEAAQERAIRDALRNPGCRDRLPPAGCAPQPVPLWLHPSPPRLSPATERTTEDRQSREEGGRTKDLEDRRRRQAERTAPPEQDRGLVTIRMENIFSWAEYVKVDRGTEENEDLDQAADAADDMDLLSLTRDGKAAAGRLRFDLDLPAEANDDRVLGDGILLPEWDFKRQRLQPDHCRLVPMLAAQADPCGLPQHLRKTARRLRAQFQHLTPARVWHRAQQDGSEIDLNAYLCFTSDRAAGRVASADRLYRALRAGARDLACLLLADLSLSTDTWISDHARVIDVIRDSLFLFAESLSATGDRFAMYGFSSRRRDPVRFHQLKTFDEPYSTHIRGRINAIKPGYYTRMGAAIRQGTKLLEGEFAGRRLLLLLTDGKPNDLDKYEGRYGIEDTRHAIGAARKLGLQPFCITVDEKANDYLPHLFGRGGFVVIRKPSQLPRELPLLYARLTAS